MTLLVTTAFQSEGLNSRSMEKRAILLFPDIFLPASIQTMIKLTMAEELSSSAAF